MSTCCRKAGHPPRRQDSTWSWVVCISATLTTIVICGINNSFAVVMPVLLEHYKGTRQSTAWVGSISQSLTFFAAPLTGALVARFGFRITAVIGTIACAVALLVTSFTSSLLQMYFAYSLLYGVGNSFIFISGVFATTKYFKKRRALALGIVSSGINLGVLSEGPLMQLLIDKFGWRMMYRIAACMVVATSGLVLTFDPNVDEEPPLRRERIVNVVPDDSTILEDSVDCSPSVSAMSKCAMIGETLCTPVYLVAIATLFMGVFCSSVTYVHMVEYCIEVGIATQDASRLFIYIGVCSLVSAIITGRILDIPAVNPFHVQQVAAVVMAASMLLLQMASEYKHFVIFSVFMGFGLGSFTTIIILLLMATVRPQLTIVAYTFGEMMISIGNASGPPVIGFIADVYGSYKPAYYTAGGIMVLAALIPFLQYCFKPWRRSPTQVAREEDQRELMLLSTHAQEQQTKRIANHFS